MQISGGKQDTSDKGLPCKPLLIALWEVALNSNSAGNSKTLPWLIKKHDHSPGADNAPFSGESCIHAHHWLPMKASREASLR